MSERLPVVIEAALNGGRHPSEHSAIPLSPQEIAAEAKPCFAAGAAVAHIHARTIEGGWSFDPDWYAEAHRQIRDAAPGMLISDTSFRFNGTPVDAVIDSLRSLAGDPVTRPDLISINLGHIALWERDTGRTVHVPNDFEDLARLLPVCGQLGVMPELGVMDFGFISNAVALRNAGLLPARPWFLLELDSPGFGLGGQVAPSTPAAYDALSAALAGQFPDSAWAAHGSGTETYPILGLAIDRGAHVRVGFEDTLTLPDGSTSTSNAEQVEVVRDMVLARGRRPATPDETGRIIGIPPAREPRD